MAVVKIEEVGTFAVFEFAFLSSLSGKKQSERKKVFVHHRFPMEMYKDGVASRDVAREWFIDTAINPFIRQLYSNVGPPPQQDARSNYSKEEPDEF